jgi:ABC-type polar amino acid transport system ATPase subunit
MPTLCPSQQEAFDGLLEEIEIGNVFVVWTPPGKGKTTMLRELHRLRGGAFLSMKSYIEEIATREPFQMEESLERILMNAMDRNEYIILLDLSISLPRNLS